MSRKDLKIEQVLFTGSNGMMPHCAVELEEAVLGAILAESQTARKYIPTIKSEYFYDPKNILIFNACCSLLKKNGVIDILTVAKQLGEDGYLEDAGGAYQVTKLSGGVASSAHIEYHIRILSQFYMRRRLREILLTNDNKAADETVDVDETIVETMNELSALTQLLPAINELREMSEVMEKVMENLKERMENSDKALTGIDTGFPPLNDLLLGWQKGSVNVIAARTGEGKTAVLMHALLVAASQGIPACLISLESRAEKLAERWILSRTEIQPDDWNRGRLTQEQWEEAEKARRELEKLEIRTFDRGSITVEEVCVVVKALHAEGKCRCLGIDYLQLFYTPKSSGNREQVVANNSRLLKLLSLQLDIPVIVLSQLNRVVIDNADQMPRIENLRESGSIEQDADTVTLLFHPEKAKLAVAPGSNYPVTPDMMMMIVAKNRNGAPGTAYISHNPNMTKFEEYKPSTEWLKKLPTPKNGKKGAADWKENDNAFQAFLKAQQEKKENGEELPF